MDCWHREIARSGTEAEVESTAQDFLSLWSPGELSEVSLGWRPVRIENASDIVRMKKWVVEDLGHDPTVSHLGELGDYLWHAAARIQEIRAVSR